MLTIAALTLLFRPKKLRTATAGRPTATPRATPSAIFLKSWTTHPGDVSIAPISYEHGPTRWGAYAPALPGLGVAGDTREEVEELIREAIPFHVEGLVAE